VRIYNLQSKLQLYRVEDLTIEEEFWLERFIEEIIQAEIEENKQRQERK